ncbi:MAG: hypothetical protein ACP5NS_00770 [Candidatus Pacearchaeota archaeon]
MLHGSLRLDYFNPFKLFARLEDISTERHPNLVRESYQPSGCKVEDEGRILKIGRYKISQDGVAPIRYLATGSDRRTLGFIEIESSSGPAGGELIRLRLIEPYFFRLEDSDVATRLLPGIIELRKFREEKEGLKLRRKDERRLQGIVPWTTSPEYKSLAQRAFPESCFIE